MRAVSVRLAAALLAAVCSLTPAFAQQKLPIIAEPSKIEWVGSKPDGKHTGGFSEFTGYVIKAEAEENSTLYLEIATNSLYSDNEKLTAHLKSPDFFDVRKFPKAVFESTRLEKKDEKTGVIHGKLTLLGHTEEIAVPTTAEFKDDRVILRAEFAIDRTAFGMDYGEGKIDKQVKIKAELHVAK